MYFLGGKRPIALYWPAVPATCKLACVCVCGWAAHETQNSMLGGTLSYMVLLICRILVA